MSQECNIIGSKIKSFLTYINIFDIPRLAREISCDVKHIREKYDETITSIEKYKEALRLEKENRQKERNLFLSVLDHIEDMLWSKDLDGRYIVANKAFRNKFCYELEWNEMQGRNDIELAKIFKEKVGNENHTFGEVCSNSDDVIIRTEEPKEFMEYGLINGKMMKLAVNKSPVYDNKGELCATCGTGRDITDWHDSLEEAINKVHKGCSCFGQEETEMLLKELNKLKFVEGDQCQH